jgi:diguanylate cyclase (GGDEF)-like protein
LIARSNYTRSRLSRRALRLIDFCIPESTRLIPHDLARARTVAAIDLAFIAVVVMSTLLIRPLFGRPGVSPNLVWALLSWLAAGFSLSLAWLRVRGSVRPAAHATVVVLFVALLVGSYYQGGDQSPSFSLYVLVPVTAGLLCGRRAGSLWGGVVIMSYVALYLMGRSGYVFEGVLEPESYRSSQLVILTLSCLAVISIVVVYDTMNAALRRTLDEERAEFEYQSRHDALTSIPNRRLFLELLDTGIRRADRTRQQVALFIIDLNDFKAVNDTHGHAAGDHVLREVALRLRGYLRITDAVARLGGDEFAVLIELLSERSDAERIAAKIRDELDRPHPLHGEQVVISSSIGVAIYPDDAGDADSLREAADSAMYGAKYAGVGYCLADGDHHEKS